MTLTQGNGKKKKIEKLEKENENQTSAVVMKINECMIFDVFKEK